jgi:valyl-tRNA synthetase
MDFNVGACIVFNILFAIYHAPLIDVEGYHFFCNKLWNASRFVLQNTETYLQDFDDGPFHYGLAEKWILSKLQKLIQQSRQHLEDYRFDLLAQALYEFVWHYYCDWYLELAKTTLYDPESSAAHQRATRKTLLFILDQILRLCHPIIPFITEEIWTKVKKLNGDTSECLMWAKFPAFQPEELDETAEDAMAFIQNVIVQIRTIRSEMGINPGKKVPVFVKIPKNQSFAKIEAEQAELKRILIEVCLVTNLHRFERTTGRVFTGGTFLPLPG